MARATIRDVAQRAGVSPSTVSAVLNRSGRVSEPLVRRILDAIEEMDYRPNGVARSLRRRTTETVGVVIPTILSPFFPPVLKAIDDLLTAEGLTMLFANTKEEDETERSLVSVMHDKRVDGLLIVPSSDGIVPRLEEFVREGIPVVALHTGIAAGRLDCVIWDDYGGSLAAIRHLLAGGRRRIALLKSNSRGLLPRIQAYETGLKEAGIELDPALYLTEGTAEQIDAFEAGRAAIDALLRLDCLPDAIFIASSSYLTLGVIERAREAELSVPADLAVVAYDDYPWMKLLSPPLSTVARDGASLGHTAAQLLLKRMRSDSSHAPETVVLPTKLMVRGSTASNRLTDERSQRGSSA